MAKMEVIVDKLNRRRSPVLDLRDKSNIVDVIVKGTTFERVNEIENNLGKWYCDSDGFYYWGGGLKDITNAFENFLYTAGMEINGPNTVWLNALKISEVWKITRGDLANVAVLDTGINLENQELRANLFSQDLSVSCHNFLDETNDVTDQFGHGSHCSSLIASQNQNIAIALAPQSKLLIGKISAFGEMRGYEMLTKGILWACSINSVDIISISFGLNDEHPTFKAFADAVKFAVSKNKIIVAAIGDKEFSPSPVYPALFEDCISVGACDASFNEWEGNAKSEKTLLYAPGVDLTSYVVVNDFFPTDPFSMSGSSQATAVVAGTIALMISHLKKKEKKYNTQLIKKILVENSTLLSSDITKRAIDPFKIFQTIK
jgi:subtilisin family serine protease